MGLDVDIVTALSLVGVVVVCVFGVGLALAAEAWVRRSREGATEARVQRASQVRSLALAVTFLLALVPLVIGVVFGSSVVAIPVVALAAFSLRHTVEDLFAGVMLSLHPAFRRGNLIRVDQVQGRVLAVGPVRLQIRSTEEGDVSLPNRLVWAQRLVNLSREGSDSPISVRLPVPSRMDGREAMSVAVVCAATSPFASLHKRPETFLEFDEGDAGRAWIRVRGFVFDPVHAETYRSHIVEAWFERVRGST